MKVKGPLPENLNEMLDLIVETSRDKSEVAFEDLLKATGRRSFGPLLVLAGVILVAPLVGDIPGVSTSVGLVVLLISVQLLAGRTHFWFPGWIRHRAVSAIKVRKAVKAIRRPARAVDRLLRHRLEVFVHGAGTRAIAAVTTAIALVTPGMELVPFSAIAGGAILTLLGLALIAHDGLIAVVGFAFAVVALGLLVNGLLL